MDLIDGPRARVRWGLWLAGFVVAVGLVAAPAAWGPTPAVPMGTPPSAEDLGAGDPLHVLWWIDWVWHHPDAVWAGEAHDPTQLFPFGLDHRLLLSFQNVVLLALRPLGSPVAAYNLCWVLAFLFAAAASAALAYEVSGSAHGAFVAGLFVAFGPPFYAHSLEHVFKLLAFGWLPLFVLFLHRWLHRGGLGSMLGTLGCAFLILASDWYNALYAALAAAVVWTAWAASPGDRGRARPTLALLLMLPLLGGFLWWALGSIPEVQPRLVLGTRAERVTNSVDLVNLLLPPAHHAVLGPWSAERLRDLPGHLVEKTAFFGWLVPCALAWGVWRERRDPRVWTWLALAAVLLVLALGPRLQWEGVRSIRLPGFWIQDLPGFSGDRAPGRYVLGASMSVGVLLSILLSRRRRPGRDAALVVLLMAVEFAPFATPFEPLRESAAVRRLARGEARGTVLDVPFAVGVPRYLYDQTLHRRPVVSGHMIRMTRRHSRHPAALPGFGIFRYPLEEPLPDDPGGLARGLRELLRVRHVVIHKRLLPEWETARDRLLSSGLPLSVTGEDGEVVVLSLGSPDSPGPPPSVLVAGTDGFYRRVLMLGWGGGGSLTDPFLWGRRRWQVLALVPPPGARALGLEVKPYVGTVLGREQRLTLGVGPDARVFALRPGWQEVELPVPSHLDPPWRLVFTVDETGRPVELEPGHEDRRSLAVALRRLRWIE